MMRLPTELFPGLCSDACACPLRRRRSPDVSLDFGTAFVACSSPPPRAARPCVQLGIVAEDAHLIERLATRRSEVRGDARPLCDARTPPTRNARPIGELDRRPALPHRTL